MALSILYSRAITGLTVIPIRVEVDLARGLPSFSIVGLPDAAVRESRERVRAAIVNSGFEFPSYRVTVNLAPADLPKDSGRFDLSIAIGILLASQQVSHRVSLHALQEFEFVGELSMTGTLLPVRAVFALASDGVTPDEKTKRLVLPLANRAEASLTQRQNLLFAASLCDVVACIERKQEFLLPTAIDSDPVGTVGEQDWSDIIGQDAAKSAAIVAVAGRHNLLMFGPPGVGKSMIAQRLPTLLPDLSLQDAREVAAIKSIDQSLELAMWRRPPYRAPHHTTPSRALIGGGQTVRPGEISLAHHGVLFLDELPEFARDALESLREPLETAEVRIARVRERVTFPADVMLVAAMNPCPCGFFGVRNAKRACRCPTERVERYRARISGPLMDRFDLAVQLHAVPHQGLVVERQALTSAEIALQVDAAHHRQRARQGRLNGRLSVAELNRVAVLTSAGQALMHQAAQRWGWSARAWHRTLRVARTIADLNDDSSIHESHVAQAIEMHRATELG